MSGIRGSEDERRTQILEAAARLLDHYGPHKTTVSDIAREAGVGVGSVYLEFPSKEAIIEELSRRRHTTVLGAMRKAADGAAGEGYARRLQAAMDARVESFLAQARGGAHAGDLVHCFHSAVQGAHERYQQEERALLSDLLAEGSRTGDLDVGDPEIAARALQRAYASFCPPALYFMPREDLLPLLSVLHHIILNGLVRRS